MVSASVLVVLVKLGRLHRRELGRSLVPSIAMKFKSLAVNHRNDGPMGKKHIVS
jgi:hypothetical protein